MRKYVVIGIIVLVVLLGSSIYYFHNYDSTLINLSDIRTDPEYDGIVYDNEENVINEDILGILTIEKIGLKASVKEGSKKSILKEYIGHIENTSIYDGNIGLAGHNRGYKNSYFARINELEIGDGIMYKTKFYTRNYKVDNIQVIFETDWNLLQNTEENKLTLITCIPNKKNQRLCVQATENL